MSNPNTDPKTESLSPFQNFIKENATGPTEGASSPGPQGTDQAEPEESAEDSARLQESPAPTPEQKEPSSLQELIRQKQGHDEPAGEGESHEVFTDLAKPGKGASRSEQINYVKEVGRRWEARAKELEGEVGTLKGQTFDPKETDEWKEISLQVEKYKTEAEKAADLQEKLAAVDLQYDPAFQRDITEPIGREENDLLEIIKVSKGEDAGSMVPMLQAAVAAPTEAEFLQATHQITSELEPHFAHASFQHLRTIRNLYAKRNQYIANHQETSKQFQAERMNQNKAQSSQYLQKDWKRYRETAEGSVSGTWDMLDKLGIESLSEQAKKTKGQAVKWAEAGMRETLDQYGGVSESVAQTVALAPELLSLIPLVDQAMAYIKNQNEEHSKIKREYEKLTQSKGSTSGRPDRRSETNSDDAPGSLVDFARQQGVLS